MTLPTVKQIPYDYDKNRSKHYLQCSAIGKPHWTSLFFICEEIIMYFINSHSVYPSSPLLSVILFSFSVNSVNLPSSCLYLSFYFLYFKTMITIFCYPKYF